MLELIIPLSLSIVFVLFWLSIFSLYAQEKKFNYKMLYKTLLIGTALALLALAIEQYLLYFFHFEILPFTNLLTDSQLKDLLRHLIFTFFLSALIEEGLKFFALRQIIYKSDSDRVFDGMRIGLWLGIGFALIENSYYFYAFFAEYQNMDLARIIIVRGLVATLAHGLYGVIAGYYLSLDKFHKLYRPLFLKTGFLTCLLVHGLFNFFLVVNMSFVSIILILFLLGVVFVWYDDRRNFQSHVAMGKVPARPFLSDSHEVEAMVATLKPSIELFQKILKVFIKK